MTFGEGTCRAMATQARAKPQVSGVVDVTFLCTNTWWPLVTGTVIELSEPNAALRRGDGDR